jgi:ribose transport system substrate-binding protein
MIEQVEGFRSARAGGLVVAPVDPASLAPALRRMIWKGAYVGAVVPPPATSLLNAPQYLTGKTLGDAAASYIRDKLGGKANVVLLTHDSLQFLSPRFVAMRDSLKDIPGAEIVADISPPTVNKEGGYKMMQTILLAHPEIDVVLGADTELPPLKWSSLKYGFDYGGCDQWQGRGIQRKRLLRSCVRSMC